MTPIDPEPLIWGFIGGLLGHMLKLVHHANLPKKDRPVLLGDHMFWVGGFVSGLLGTIMTMAYVRSGINLPAFAALNIGASAPLIAGKLLSSVPAVGKTDIEE